MTTHSSLFAILDTLTKSNRRGVSYSAEQQKQDFSTMTQEWSAIQNDKSDLAINIRRRQKDARKTSEQPPDQDDEQMIADLQSGDPSRISAVKNMLGVTLASIAGPEHFASTDGAVQKADDGYPIRYREGEGDRLTGKGCDPVGGFGENAFHVDPAIGARRASRALAQPRRGTT